MNNINQLFETIKIRPKNIALYELALTHPSCNIEAKTVHHDYERLEYIGDAVLGFVSADLIYKIHPEMDQGYMSKLRSYLVKSSALAEYARKISLFNYVKAGRSLTAEQVSKSDKILEDIFEALIGAIYLDLGINVAYSYIKRFIKQDIVKSDIDDLTDPKTKLQEEMQTEYRESVHYELVGQDGPAHDRTFKVNVLFNDIVLATGMGKTKKQAEEDAARKALEKRSK